MASVVRELRIAEEMTKNNTGLVLTMAVNYGGRQEIVAAVNKILQEVSASGSVPKSITEKTIQKRLYVQNFRTLICLALKRRDAHF